MGYIILTAFNIIVYLPFLCILWGPLISKHSLFHGIYSASLAGILPYFLIDRFVRWHMSHSVTFLRTAPIMYA